MGLFADGTSNYGGSWNGVTGSVTGLFYGGGAAQLIAQLIGVVILLGFVFTLSFAFNLFVDFAVGQRVSAASELDGLDFPEMGALGYPKFALKAYREKPPLGGVGAAISAAVLLIGVFHAPAVPVLAGCTGALDYLLVRAWDGHS